MVQMNDLIVKYCHCKI